MKLEYTFTDVKYLLSRLVILLFLIIPFGLSRIGPSLEPFPAVIFPAGNVTVSVSSEINQPVDPKQGKRIQTKIPSLKRAYTSRIEQTIIAIYEDGKEFTISLHDLLSTMPSSYRNYVLSSNFGLNSKKGGKHVTFRFGIYSVSVDVSFVAEHSSEVRREGIQWIQRRIKELTSYRDSEVYAITIRRYEKYMPIQKEAPEFKIKLIAEQIVILH